MARFTRPGPAFIMLGMSVTEGRVRIYASTMVYDAQIEVKRDPIERRFGDPGFDWADRTYVPGPTEITITARMGHVVMAEGATYAEALATLFGMGWTPEPEEARVLPPKDSWLREEMRGIEPAAIWADEVDEVPLGLGREHGNDFGGPPTIADGWYCSSCSRRYDERQTKRSPCCGDAWYSAELMRELATTKELNP